MSIVTSAPSRSEYYTKDVKMRFKFLKIVLIGLVCLSLPATTYAVPILQGQPTAATGITGLTIGGVVYDVVFSESGAYEDQGPAAATFMDDSAGAEEAVMALNEFLNGRVDGILGAGWGDQHVIIAIAYKDFGDVVEAVSTLYQWKVWATREYPHTPFKSEVYPDTSWASFTSVPLQVDVSAPPTLAIIALSLLGLAARRFKK
jgi:hypothetical protein